MNPPPNITERPHLLPFPWHLVACAAACILLVAALLGVGDQTYPAAGRFKVERVDVQLKLVTDTATGQQYLDNGYGLVLLVK